MLKLTLNGKQTQTNLVYLQQLLEENNIPSPKVAVEVDGEIVPRSSFKSFALKEGQKIEIITFVGGG